jgi:4-amino-4-deoxy-L-arabinose transferase-like glycosyltransferase
MRVFKRVPEVNHTEDRRNAVLLLALIASYVIAVAVLISFRTAPFIGNETDGVYYMLAARALFTKAFAPPTFGGGVGMPIAIASINHVFPDTFRSAQIVSAFAGLLFLLSAARVLTKLYSSAVGLTTGLLLFVSPIFLVNSTTSLTDVLGACLPLAGLWMLLSDRKWPRWSPSLIAGLLFGAAYTVRSINFVFLPLLLVALVVPRDGIRRNLKNLLPAAIGVFVGILPQLYVNQKYFGNPFYSDNWRNIAALVFDWDHVNKLSSFSEVVRQAGPALLFLWIKRLVIDIPLALYHVGYLPLFFSVPGVFLMLSKARDREKRVLATWTICILLYLLLVAPVWRIELRYFLPVLPLLLSGGIVMWRSLTQKHRALSTAGLAVAIVMSLVVTAQEGRQLLRGQSIEFKEAGLFLRERVAEGENILASQPSVFLYAHHQGMLFESFSDIDLDRLDATVASNHVAWIVFDERRGAHENPSLGWLLDPSSPQAAKLGWRAVFESGSPRIVIWRPNDLFTEQASQKR